MLSNIELIKEHFCDDEELVGELLEVFESTYPEVISKLETALTQDNRDNVKLEAHTLKGMISNFFSEDLKKLTLEIESNSESFSAEEITTRVEALKAQIPLMVEEIRNAKF